MNVLSGQQPDDNREQTLTLRVFHRLLGWLDEGADSGGQQYLEMRRRLVAYFDRKNCQAPDELADDVLNRVARRLDEEGTIESETPAKYCYIVARFVFMEHLRRARKTTALLENVHRQLPDGSAAGRADDESASREKTLKCLERCAGRLDPGTRGLIIRYYIGKERAKIENRRALAASLGITMNALSIRACRIREKLGECVRRCVAAG